MINDFAGKAVLITGGTRGIGLATGLSFARQGADTYLTYRWGSADEAELRELFARENLAQPVLIEADAGQEDEMHKALAQIQQRHDRIDVFISNVCVSMLGGDLESHESRSMIRSLEYSSFPFVAYLLAMKKRFGSYPSYALATSSEGPDRYLPKYHYVAVAKAVLETFARYMATHLQDEGTKVNVLRTRGVITESYKDVFGERAVAMTKVFDEFEVHASEVADAIFALCSGLFDAVSGQVITLDKSAGFADNLLNLSGRLLDQVGGTSP